MSQNIGTQTEAKVNVDIGTQTKDSANNIFVIQRKDKGKKRSTYKKRDIKNIPNAYPTIEQQYRIFTEIDYPYLMRNVGIQGDDELYDDKLINTLREGLGIKKMTPELVAERALEEGRKYQNVASHTIYSPTEQNFTDTQRLVRAINKNPDLRRRVITSLNSIQNKESIQPLTFEEMAKNYMSELSAYKEARWGEAGAKDIGIGTEQFEEKTRYPFEYKPPTTPYWYQYDQEKEFEDMVRAKVSAFGSLGAKIGKPREPASFISNKSDLDNLIGIMENTGVYEGRRTGASQTLQAFMRRELSKKITADLISKNMKEHDSKLKAESEIEKQRVKEAHKAWLFNEREVKQQFKKLDVENFITKEKQKASASETLGLLRNEEEEQKKYREMETQYEKRGRGRPKGSLKRAVQLVEEKIIKKRGRPPKNPQLTQPLL